VKAGIQEALTKPEARAEALRRFQSLPPDEQRSILTVSKTNGLPPEAGMLFHLLSPVYSFKKHEESLNEKSAVGYGRQVDEEAMNFLTEWASGVQKGQFDGVQDKDALELFGINPTNLSDLKQGKGNVIIPTFDGFVFDHQKEKVPADARHTTGIMERDVTIKQIAVDRQNQKWHVDLSDGNKKVVSFDQFMAEIAPSLAGNNKDEFDAIGKTLVAAKNAGYMPDIKGGGAMDMTKVNQGNKSKGGMDLTEEQVRELDDL
jgi:hypothetical protein